MSKDIEELKERYRGVHCFDKDGYEIDNFDSSTMLNEAIDEAYALGSAEAKKLEAELAELKAKQLKPLDEDEVVETMFLHNTYNDSFHRPMGIRMLAKAICARFTAPSTKDVGKGGE